MSAAREALLDRCMAYLQDSGFSDLSIREIAAGVGTSHRMLIYHFGTREQLLVAIVERIEAAQRTALADLVSPEGDLTEVGRQFWRRVSDPTLAPATRLFFEIYSHAIYRRPWTDSFRATVVDAWAEPLAELLVQRGFDPAEARQRARLGLAATRGLILDLLVTGEREILDAAGDLLSELLVQPTRATGSGAGSTATLRAEEQT
ncbi:TetR/AcrR family transcriptional regulator [Micromonospora halophytica]|uniref:Transcriptional regulator, TetR family n=1 Tax=Micromonospora halophytica TaxID=47864 RepID=A0A1C5J8F0_9ACTN|nr:TetR/AcrR family transcriptional regulator [Micromonospora halophytica]SCG66439.1 transcriptional regulator, TetR family [Micromonospora halophytica]